MEGEPLRDEKPTSFIVLLGVVIEPINRRR
jgi:hypothetical protein